MNVEHAVARYEKRRSAVAAVQEGVPIPVVARIHDVKPRTLFRWLARYRSGGWHALREGQRSGRPRKVTPEVMEWLYQAITLGDPRQYQLEFSLWTLDHVRVMLKRVQGIVLSKSSVSRLLRQLGLSPQRPLYRAYQQDPRQLERYLRVTFPQLKRRAQRRGAVIYFVDECAVRSDHHRGTTWGAVGQTPVVPDGGGRWRLNLISAVTARGDLRFGTFPGRMSAERFIAFLQKLRRDTDRPIIVIADNASYHTAGKVKRFVAASEGEIELHHLPPYAPEYNPDEQVWNQAKRRLGQRFIDGAQTLKQAMVNILRSLQKQPALIRSFFRLKDTRYILDN